MVVVVVSDSSDANAGSSKVFLSYRYNGVPRVVPLPPASLWLAKAGDAGSLPILGKVEAKWSKLLVHFPLRCFLLRRLRRLRPLAIACSFSFPPLSFSSFFFLFLGVYRESSSSAISSSTGIIIGGRERKGGERRESVGVEGRRELKKP